MSAVMYKQLKKAGKSLNSIGIYEVLSLLGILTVIIVCALKRSFFFSGTVLGASLVAYILAFLISSYALKRQGMGFERIFFAVAGAAAARWLFEIVYHYAFPGSLRHLSADLTSFSTNTGGAQFPLIWSIMMVMIIFTGYKYMAAGKWFWITLAVTVVSFGFWLLIGYPQWVHPEQWPFYHPLIQVIPMKYSHSSNELAQSFISNTSLAVNSISKIAVCTLLPVLFLGKGHRR
jgi:hypothetical protein